jgi:site-specific recombinase XerD
LGVRARGGWNQDSGLYGAGGERKYLNREERSRVLAALESLDAKRALFCLLLAWTGARISELLALTPRSFQLDAGVVSIITLKRRRFTVREVPIPPDLMSKLDLCFGLRGMQQGEHSSQQRLWGFCRQTAWCTVKEVMLVAGIHGRYACPRGLRHSFGVNALQAGVPLNLIQRWMGHARLSTTAIYADVSGPEEVGFATRFWQASSHLPEFHAT